MLRRSVFTLALTVPLFTRAHAGGLMRAPKNVLFFGGDAVSLATLTQLHNRAQKFGGQLEVVHPPDAPQPATTASGRRTKAAEHHHHSHHTHRHEAHFMTNPIAAFCAEHSVTAIPAKHPKILHSEAAPIELGDLSRFDVCVVCSCRYFLPSLLLSALPPTINMHPSLLPKYRGASPIYETLRRGDEVGGVSVIQLRPREPMDTGAVLLQRELPIPAAMDLRSYFPLAADAGAAAVMDVLDDFQAYWEHAVPQARRDVHFRNDEYHAGLLGRHPGRVNFEAQSGVEVFNTWRAFVTYAAVGCMFRRACTPVGAKIKNPAKVAPAPITFNEAVPLGALSKAVRDELRVVADQAKPGAAYFPYTLNEDGNRAGLVRCRGGDDDGWFAFTSATVRNSTPVCPATLAATWECRPGFVYNGVFSSPTPTPDGAGKGAT